MQVFKHLLVAVFAVGSLTSLKAQYTDTVITRENKTDTIPKLVNWKQPPAKKAFPFKSFIIPGALIAYGFTSIESNGLKNFNAQINDEVYAESPHKKSTVDNYLQFAPAVAVYGLNAMGVYGKHNFRDRSMLYLMSNIIVTTTVFSVKKISHQIRPDSSAYTSFPSGHTAEAFASAEFMWQEYKDVSPWYGIAGYAIAATTGYLRLYNNKHWFSDVVAGAGFGIASTKLAYWLYPKIQHRLFKDKPVSTMVLPTYQNGSFGFGMVHTF